MLWAPFHKAFAFVIRKEERKKKKNTSQSFQSQVNRLSYVVNFLQEQLQIVHRLIISRVLYQDISPYI